MIQRLRRQSSKTAWPKKKREQNKFKKRLNKRINRKNKNAYLSLLRSRRNNSGSRTRSTTWSSRTAKGYLQKQRFVSPTIQRGSSRRRKPSRSSLRLSAEIEKWKGRIQPQPRQMLVSRRSTSHQTNQRLPKFVTECQLLIKSQQSLTPKPNSYPRTSQQQSWSNDPTWEQGCILISEDQRARSVTMPRLFLQLRQTC